MTEIGRPRRRPAVTAWLAAAVLASAVPSLAAPAPRRAASGPSRGPDLYAGYSHTKAGAAGLDGWSVAGSRAITGRLRATVDLTGHYGSFATATLSQTALVAGVRAVWSWQGFEPFVDGGLGFARTSVSASGLREADTDWGLCFGGGVDRAVARQWSARGLAQVRFLHGEGAWDSDPRLSLGVVYRFGR